MSFILFGSLEGKGDEGFEKYEGLSEKNKRILVGRVLKGLYLFMTKFLIWGRSQNLYLEEGFGGV